MKKSFFLLVPAAFGLLALTACDESTTSGSTTTQSSACSLNPSETGLEITCNNESFGFLKTSSGGVYGSCGAEALRDDSGYKLVCGGDSVGVVYNGKAGRNGVNGENGQPGQPGEKGDPGDKGDAGSSCSAKQVTTGFEIYCGDVKVGTVLNGANGYSCSVKAGTTTSTATISCEDGSKATLNAIQGIQGVAGENCTTSGLRKTETSLTSDYYGQSYSEITCDGETIKVYDGKSVKGDKGDKGDDGVGCSAVKSATTGDITITCGAGDDETVAVITKPLNGTNGDNCSVTKVAGSTVATVTCGETSVKINDGTNGTGCSAVQDKNGDITITCGDSDPYKIEKPINGTNGTNCTVNKEDGVATITCEDGTEETVSDGTAGAKGDAGYSCSSTAGVGYVDVKCQTGVDEDEKPVYTTNRILAAGFATCGDEDEVYNTLTHTCVAGVVTAFDCGSAMLGSDQFCENGVAYETADYWTAATTYPKATYGRCDDESDPKNIVIGDYYLKASQYCVGTVATDKYQECGGVLYNATTHFCNAGATYALCNGVPYDPATEFCSADVKYDKCGEAVYDPAKQYCSSTFEVTALSACTVDENTILYNPETHDCDDGGDEPIVTPKE